MLRYADLVIHLETHEVWRGYTPLSLTPTEFALLECLIRSAGRVVTRQRLIETVWGMNPVKTTLQDVFLKLVEDYEGAG
jgi:two-component system response regulator MprA